MNTTRQTAQPCPSCGAELDASTGVGHDNEPKPGDVSLCAYCGEVLTFGPGLERRRLSDDELTALPADVLQSLARARAMIEGRTQRREMRLVGLLRQP